MAVEVRRLFTVDEYQAMELAGILTDDDRVELLDGDIVRKPPVNPPHAGTTNRLNRIFTHALGDRVVVAIQNDVVLRPRSQPQPDVAILRFRDDFYGTTHAEPPDDILLLVEVADTTVRDDRRVKVPIYARAGIREVWLADVNARRIEVYRDPTPDGYTSVTILAHGESVSPLAPLPDLVVAVEDVVP